MDSDQFSAEETERRLEKTLEGAFSGPPTLLKDIPTRQGKQRVKRKPQEPRRRQVAQHFLAVGNCASGGPRAHRRDVDVYDLVGNRDLRARMAMENRN